MADASRQYGECLERIRRDHVERYRFAVAHIPSGSSVTDIACGCGYGTWMLHSSGLVVTGIDICREAIDFAERYYPGPRYVCADAGAVSGDPDAIVSFETIEHLEHPEVMLGSIRAKLLIASVPNEEVWPFRAETFMGDEYPHRRHYTPTQFEEFLEFFGYGVTDKFCQLDKRGMVVRGTHGRFLIYVCGRD